MEFAELPIKSNILRAIDSLGYKTPTEIQLKSIPSLLSGDISRQKTTESDFIGPQSPQNRWERGIKNDQNK